MGRGVAIGCRSGLFTVASQRSQPTPPAALGQVPRLGRMAWQRLSCARMLCRVRGVTRSSAEARGQPEDADQATMRAIRTVAGGCPDTTSSRARPSEASLVRGFSVPRPEVLPAPAEPANSMGLALHLACLALRPGSSPPPPASTAPLSRLRGTPLRCGPLPRRRGSVCPAPGCSAVRGVTRSSAEARGQPEDADQATMRAIRTVAGGCPDTTSSRARPSEASLVRGFSVPRPDMLPDPSRTDQFGGVGSPSRMPRAPAWIVTTTTAVGSHRAALAAAEADSM